MLGMTAMVIGVSTSRGKHPGDSPENKFPLSAARLSFLKIDLCAFQLHSKNFGNSDCLSKATAPLTLQCLALSGPSLDVSSPRILIATAPLGCRPGATAPQCLHWRSSSMLPWLASTTASIFYLVPLYLAHGLWRLIQDCDGWVLLWYQI